ncbi:MAG: biotin--[acetyl-CoA-carboxylase] ligase [Bacteroidia bacterium]
MFSSVGHSIISLSEVDSTNNYAAILLNETKVTNGTIILAKNQTKGKGQLGSVWVVEPSKNLTFSVILTDLKIQANRQFLISAWAACSLSYFLEEYFAIKNHIKWPNDIIVNGKKIAGVLIENSLKGQEIQHSIIGVGFNINQANFPKGIGATSVFNELGKEQNLDAVFEQLLSYFNRFYLYLAKQDDKSLFDAYYSKLYGYNTKIALKDNDGYYEGTIKQILSDGRLVVDKNGAEKTYSLKELEFLMKSE